MSNVSRRDFLKGVGGVTIGLGCFPIMGLLGVDTKAKAEATAEPARKYFENLNNSDELLQAVLNESEVTSDLTLSSGKVIPAIYVRMRNRINRIGKGIGSIPAENSFDMIMNLWSPEDAENYMKMPLHELFTAANYAAEAGITEEEAEAILWDQSKRNLIYRVNRAGQYWYSLMPWVNGFWEFCELDILFNKNEGGDPLNPTPDAVAKVAEFNSWGINNAGIDEYNTTFALFRSYPIGVEAVAEDKLLPYEDWRAVIKRHKLITVSPCQCRSMFKAVGVPIPEEHPMETCLSFGDVAEYFIENNLGRQIDQAEAVSIMENAIAKGMVVEALCAKNPDILCCCHADSCGNLMGFRGFNGEVGCAKYYSAYTLEYDAEKCLKCGLCVSKCPMHSITQTEEGIVVTDNACVRCGQCVPSCPGKARILKQMPDYPELPDNYLETNKFFAKDRIQRGTLFDFTGDKL